MEKSANTDSLEFIKSCFQHRNIFWTYHVNMRLKERLLTHEQIISAIDSFEIIEEYPQDKYLPSCLLFARNGNVIFHIHVALDRENDNIRIITSYIPTPDKWDINFKIRKKV